MRNKIKLTTLMLLPISLLSIPIFVSSCSLNTSDSSFDNKDDINSGNQDNSTNTENPDKNDISDNIDFNKKLNSLVANNKNLVLKNSSKYKNQLPTSINENNLSINELNYFSIDENIFDRNLINFKIVNQDDLTGTIKANLKYKNYISLDVVTISGFLTKEDNSQTEKTDKYFLNKIYELNKEVDVSNFKDVSQRIPSFYLHNNIFNGSDELKNFFNLPDGADWSKVRFNYYGEDNKLGTLQLFFKYGKEKEFRIINLKGFLKVDEWIDKIVNNNKELYLKNVNKKKPSEIIRDNKKYYDGSEFKKFVGEESIPEWVGYNILFAIVPTGIYDDDKGTLEARIEVDNGKHVSKDTITIKNYERTTPIAETFAKLNPELDFSKLMHDDNVDLYGDGWNYSTILSSLMASQRLEVAIALSNVIYEIPWKLNGIEDSIEINKQGDDIGKFNANFKLEIIRDSINDKEGTAEAYVGIIYDKSFPNIERNPNAKIKLKGFCNYSQVVLDFVYYNPILYIDKSSPLYSKNPKDVKATDIKTTNINGRSDIEMIVVQEWWLPFTKKISYIDAKDKNGNLIPPKDDRIFAHVLIDGVGASYKEWEYVEIVWNNR